MKIFVKTLGCPKNFNDTQVFTGLLASKGHQITQNPSESEAIIVNTCGFIQDAKTESIDAIFELASEGKILIVTGCLSQRYGKELYDEMPEVDIFLGVNDYDKLPQILDSFEKGKRVLCANAYTTEFEFENRLIEKGSYSNTIKIAEGCDNHCTYCAIPLIRGPFRSRPKELVLNEARKLAEQGIKELILIAQDTTRYGEDLYEDYNLSSLLKDLCKIEKIVWIRLMYCYEHRITDELIQTIKTEDKICKYIDMPLQHLSDDVLQSMNRRSNHDGIIHTISKLKKEIPDIAIRTTFITGFPGETEDDFVIMFDGIESIEFDRLGVFAYSAEEDTPAANFPNQVPNGIAKERADIIMRSQIDISLSKNRSKIGQELLVLLEYQDETGTWIGRSQYDAPEIDCAVIVKTNKEHAAGDFVLALIEDAFDYDLVGKEID